MSIAFSDEVKARIAEHYDPHCVAWVRATAALWGSADDHDLDEPVQLTEAVPVRVRFVPHRGDFRAVTDRNLSLDTIRSGRHAMLRLTFKARAFLEFEIQNISAVSTADKTIGITIT